MEHNFALVSPFDLKKKKPLRAENLLFNDTEKIRLFSSSILSKKSQCYLWYNFVGLDN